MKETFHKEKRCASDTTNQGGSGGACQEGTYQGDHVWIQYHQPRRLWRSMSRGHLPGRPCVGSNTTNQGGSGGACQEGTYQGDHVWDLIPPTKAALEEHVKRAPTRETMCWIQYHQPRRLRRSMSRGHLPGRPCVGSDTTNQGSSGGACQEGTYQGGHVLDPIPPTKAALEEHVKRAPTREVMYGI